MDLGLAAKVAIVTGASRGLGRAAATALAAEGVSVLAAARSADALDELARPTPIASPRSRSTCATATPSPPSPRRRSTASAASTSSSTTPASRPPRPSPTRTGRPGTTCSPSTSPRPRSLAHAAGTIFIDQGSGKVINIASTSGLRGKPLLAAYSASKGALLRFTEALAAEWAPLGIQVNAIAPGAFVTDAQRAVTSDEQLLARRIRKIPARRMGDPDEFGAMVAFLASPLSDFVSGATFVIDGGEVAKL